MWAPGGVVPRVALASTFPPDRVEQIGSILSDGCGGAVRAVRWVAFDGPAFVVEVEAEHPPLDGWVAVGELRDEEVAAWHSAGADGVRAPWERPGWFAGAVEAFRSAVGSFVEEPVLVKGAWPCSAVLRATTPDGRVFFKAGSTKPPREPATLAALSAVVPSLVPSLVARDGDDDWMVTADHGAQPATDHAAVLREFASLQLTVGAGVDPMPDFAPSTLASRVEHVADDVALLEGVRRRAAELASSPIAPAIVLQDFRAGNVALGSPFCFFDWTDVVLAHPFFSGIRYLDMLWQVDEAWDWRTLHSLDGAPPWLLALRDAYLAPFAEVCGMERARRDFALAWSLQGAFMAARWDWEQSHLDQSAPWTRMLRSFTRNEWRERVRARVPV